MSLAKKIVNEILSDLTDRRGLSSEWEGIDEDIQKEIKAKWIDLTEKAIAADREAKRVEQVNRSIYPGK